MDRQEILDMFFQSGTLVKGHYLLTSGRHSDLYLQSAQAFSHTDCSVKLAGELAKRFGDEQVDIVLGPAIGGIILAYEVAKELGALSMYCERENGHMMLKRGFAIEPHQHVLIVEDVVTSGASMNEVVELVQHFGGEVVGIGVIVDRTLGNVDFGVRLESVIELDLPSYPPDECPYCEKDEPLTQPLQGKKG